MNRIHSVDGISVCQREREGSGSEVYREGLGNPEIYV